VQFNGIVPHAELMSRLRRSNVVLAHPSKSEACCVAISEALAAGVPVIGGTRSGDVPWQLAGGEAGVLVDVTSPTEIATAVASLTDAATRRGLADRGYAQAQSLHSYSAWVAAYDALFGLVRGRA
jgi:glycosyltransferase involved in cell wall biosynthesis